MPYVTFRRQSSRFQQQVTLEDILNDTPINLVELPRDNYPRNVTVNLSPTEQSYRNLVTRYDFNKLFNGINRLYDRHIHLLEDDMSQHYHTFHIPKRTGGLRRIDAPNPELKTAQAEIKDFFEKSMNVLCHDAAHAYVPQRSTLTAMQEHQQHYSRWFLKLDLKDFFPAHNLEYTMQMLSQIFPFHETLQQEDLYVKTKALFDLGFLNNSLPQGTPLSPFLTNLLMVPIDQAIHAQLKQDLNHAYVYTRYADDLLISCTHRFNKNTVQAYVQTALAEFNAPFEIKHEKTRFGSSAGRNWNLGIMLNKDNNLTIGHKQNQRFRAALFSFHKDLDSNIEWSREDMRTLMGQISYYKMIQPTYTSSTLQKYNQQFDRDTLETLKILINRP